MTIWVGCGHCRKPSARDDVGHGLNMRRPFLLEIQKHREQWAQKPPLKTKTERFVHFIHKIQSIVIHSLRNPDRHKLQLESVSRARDTITWWAELLPAFFAFNLGFIIALERESGASCYSRMLIQCQYLLHCITNVTKVMSIGYRKIQIPKKCACRFGKRSVST